MRFKVFNRANTPGLTSNRFSYQALWEDQQGNLWVGTEDGGVIRHRDGAFTALTTKNGLPDNHVTRIDEDDAGTIWIFTPGGLAQWKDGRLTRVASTPDSPFDACLTAPKSLGADGSLASGVWTQEDGTVSPTESGPHCRCHRTCPTCRTRLSCVSTRSSKTRSASSGTT
jgi:ligand-binding sensor domain-containing protein